MSNDIFLPAGILILPTTTRQAAIFVQVTSSMADPREPSTLMESGRYSAVVGIHMQNRISMILSSHVMFIVQVIVNLPDEYYAQGYGAGYEAYTQVSVINHSFYMPAMNLSQTW